MIHRLHAISVAAALIAATPCALGQELNGQVEAALANHKLAGAKVAVSVVDLETGRELVDIHDEDPLIPASNMKLLTSGAAMLVLGRDFVFKTELVLDGTRLILRGSGDPALGDPFILERSPGKVTVDGLMSALAGAVKTTSGGSVSEIIVDDRVFDREWVHPTWPVAQLDKWYCAQVSGLNFHTNVISVFPAPSAQGLTRPPVYTLEPSVPWLEIENKARTVAGSKNSVWLGREPNSNRLTMFGEVAIPTRIPVEITLHEVPTFTGRILAATLSQEGVSIGGVPGLSSPGSRLTRDQATNAFAKIRLAAAGEVLEGRTIAVVTTSLEDVIERCNGDSQNLYAECMFKRMGHQVTREPGSWANGASVLRMTLAELPPKGLGPDCAASTQIADGSGMSRENRVAPRTFTKWLDRLQRDPSVGSVFVNSLASPNQKESLKRRFKDRRLVNELRGKTGTIDGVRCFSGYLTEPLGGRRLAFSVMVNNLKEGEQALQALDFHEEVVVIADKWLAAHRGARPAAVVPQMGGDR